jgi:AcrR family transcriptional regulator
MEQAKTTKTRAERLLDVAAEIVREGGDFELPMRELATRAKVSLRTPYEIFGSKGGVVRALLERDRAEWSAYRRGLPRGPLMDRFFSELGEGIARYGRDQPFYRALFRASGSHTGGPETEHGRTNPERFHAFCTRAVAEGILSADTDPQVLGEALTDIFAANVRTWAASDYDLSIVEARIGFGWSTLLAGAARADQADSFRARAREYQRRLAGFVGPARVVLAGIDP